MRDGSYSQRIETTEGLSLIFSRESQYQGSIAGYERHLSHSAQAIRILRTRGLYDTRFKQQR
jgi:hypothetical protein